VRFFTRGFYALAVLLAFPPNHAAPSFSEEPKNLPRAARHSAFPSIATAANKAEKREIKQAFRPAALCDVVGFEVFSAGLIV
jgi:hypothetical protein